MPGCRTEGELRDRAQPPRAGRQRQVDWGEQPDDLEVTVGGVAAAVARPDDDEPEDDEESVDPDRGERRRGAAREVVRRSHRGGARAGRGADPPAGRDASRRTHAADAAGVEGRRVRHAADATAFVAHAG